MLCRMEIKLDNQQKLLCNIQESTKEAIIWRKTVPLRRDGCFGEISVTPMFSRKIAQPIIWKKSPVPAKRDIPPSRDPKVS